LVKLFSGKNFGKIPLVVLENKWGGFHLLPVIVQILFQIFQANPIVVQPVGLGISHKDDPVHPGEHCPPRGPVIDLTRDSVQVKASLKPPYAL
jgi:hypothetical protein